MAHSNKPQPESYGPYQAECEAYASMSEAERYLEEAAYWDGAERDRYEGFDEGDLNNPSAWENDAEDEVTESPASLPVPVPVSLTWEDGDGEHIDGEHIDF